MIEKLKRLSDGSFEDESGCHWDSELDYLCIGVLPSCGCGDPKSIAVYVYDMFKKWVLDLRDDREFTDETSPSYEDLPTMFFLNWADRNGYTTHGSTVRLSWLTKEGESLFDDLKKLLEVNP